ncbi:hypothetical protein HK097_006271, partial [Rhizophlyctis rosea]
MRNSTHSLGSEVTVAASQTDSLSKLQATMGKMGGQLVDGAGLVGEWEKCLGRSGLSERLRNLEEENAKLRTEISMRVSSAPQSLPILQRAKTLSIGAADAVYGHVHPEVGRLEETVKVYEARIKHLEGLLKDNYRSLTESREITTDTINHLQSDVSVLRDQRGVWEGRAVEAERRERERAERRRKRWEAIVEFVTNEETYIHNLQTVHDYLSSLIKRRKRLSKRMSIMSTSTISQSTATPSSSLFSFPSESINGPDARRSGEDDSTYIDRLDTENEELEEVRGAIRGMLDVHGRMCSDVKALLSQEGSDTMGVVKLGDVFLRFAGAVQRPYIGYSVAALGAAREGRKSQVERLHEGREGERVEFVKGVVDRFAKERAG